MRMILSYCRDMTRTARYDDVADFYSSVSSDDHESPVTVALRNLLGEIEGRDVLDLACGQGTLTRVLARYGANVVGVELSAAMINKAREIERTEPLGIHYVQADASDSDTLAGHSFDSVVCNFGLSDIDDLDPTLANVRRVLAPGGVFAFAILHPCFAGETGVSGSWPSGASYYDEGWWRADGERSTLRRQVGANHRMLSTYFNTLRRHGLILDQIAEPPPPAEWSDTRPVASRFPVFLVVRSVCRTLDA